MKNKNVYSIDQILNFRQSTPVSGVGARFRKIVAPTIDTEERFLQEAEMFDSRTGKSVLLRIETALARLDPKMENAPVYLCATGSEAAPKGVGVLVNSNNPSKKCVCVRSGVEIFFVGKDQKTGNKTLHTYAEWMGMNGLNGNNPATQNPQAPEQKASQQQAPSQAEIESRKAALNEAKRRSVVRQNLQKAFHKARANTQVLLVCKLEALAYAALMQQHGDNMTPESIGSIAGSLLVRNGMANKLEGCMPANSPSPTAEDLALMPIIREHERIYQYKLSDVTISDLLNEIGEQDEAKNLLISTIEETFGENSGLLTRYLNEFCDANLDKAQSWRDADEVYLESLLSDPDSVTKAIETML